MKIVVSTGNVYVHNSTPEKAREELYTVRNRRKPIVVMPNEAYNRVGFYARDPWADEFYKTFQNIQAENPRAIGDNPIYLREHKDIKILGHISILGAEASRPIRIAPPRWINGLKIKYRIKKQAFINIHPHAANVDRDSGKWLDVPRAHETQKYYKKLLLLIEFLQGNGFEVVVTGDGNIPAQSDANAHGGPAWVAQQAHMRIFQHGLEVLMYTNGYQLTDTWEVTESQSGSDHPMYAYELFYRL